MVAAPAPQAPVEPAPQAAETPPANEPAAGIDLFDAFADLDETPETAETITPEPPAHEAATEIVPIQDAVREATEEPVAEAIADSGAGNTG